MKIQKTVQVYLRDIKSLVPENHNQVNIIIKWVTWIFWFPRHIKIMLLGTSLVVQWLGLWVPSAGGPGSIPGQGARSHMLQLRPREAKKKKKKPKKQTNKKQWQSNSISWLLSWRLPTALLQLLPILFKQPFWNSKHLNLTGLELSHVAIPSCKGGCEM